MILHCSNAVGFLVSEPQWYSQVAGRFNLEPFDTLALRLKGDGRYYVSTLRTESWVGGPPGMDYNTWQAYIYAPKDEWCEVKVPFERYLPTWKGKILQTKSQMNPARIVSMSLSLTAEGGPLGVTNGYGQFKLELDWIKALRCMDNR
eukprot:c24011_g1_i1 orf=573-1013(+)